jgi:alkaline phosphatase D
LIGLTLVGCRFPEPYPVTEERAVADVGRHYRAVFPNEGDPDGARDAGLLTPRFGLPAIVQRTGDFSIQVLERGGASSVRAALVRFDLPASSVARCLDAQPVEVEDCFPLRLDEQSHEAIEGGLTVRTFRASVRASTPPPARIYDLVLVSDVDPPQRARRAVDLTENDPATPREIRVVQLSDLHVGKAGHAGEIQQHLDAVIRDVNALGPDLVIVTGDMAEQGRTMALEEWAADALLQIDAPLLAIPGNHDYGHFPKVLAPDEPDSGWYNFARAFHPFRWTDVTFGGWELVGFDSGPSVFSPRVLTRGIRPETVDMLRGALDDAETEGRRGVVLFSHAPTRAVVSSTAKHPHGDGVGSMVYGAKALESLLLKARARDQRVIHLSGHTHWSDVFEATGDEFDRWPTDRLSCSRAVRNGVAMISAPSATEVSFHTIDHGISSGFVELALGDTETRVTFHLRDRNGKAVVCAAR